MSDSLPPSAVESVIDRNIETSTISEIIKKRKPYYELTENLERGLNIISNNLPKLRDKLVELAEINGTNFDTNNINKIIADIDYEKGHVSFLVRRFKRSTINIVVVGLKRNGKSELLSQLANLQKAIIPTRSGNSPCTGTRSTIFHHPLSKGQPYAEVLYHDDKTLQEILDLYWTKLDLPNKPNSPKDFINIKNLPELSSSNKINTQSGYNGNFDDDALLKKEYYEVLKKYHLYLKEIWREDIKGKTITINHFEKVQEFLVQPEQGDNSSFNHKYLIVNEVRIYCPFDVNDPDILGLGLIDLPGLGESTLGGKERIKKVLGTDADIILFVHRPMENKSPKDEDVIRAYTICRNALEPYVSLKDSAFLVINKHTVTDTSQGKAPLDNTSLCRNDLKIFREDSKYEFFSDTICDCSKPQSIQEEILKPILKQIRNHMAQMDNSFCIKSIKNINNLRSRLNILLSQIESSINIDDSMKYDEEFNKNFTELWKELHGKISWLCYKLHAEANDENQKDAQFTSLMTQILQQCENICKKNLLSEADAETEIFRYESRPVGTMETFLNEFRANFTKEFISIDKQLTNKIDDAKKEVLQILLETGKLNSILIKEESLEAIANLIAPYSNEISQAILHLNNFHLDARVIVGYKIRKILFDNLEPKLKLNKAELNKVDRADISDGAYIVEKIKCAVEKAINEIGTDISVDDYKVPSQSAFAIVAEFRDLAFFPRGIKDSWRTFYMNSQIRKQVFVSHNSLIEQSRTLRRDAKIYFSNIDEALKLLEVSVPTLNHL